MQGAGGPGLRKRVLNVAGYHDEKEERDVNGKYDGLSDGSFGTCKLESVVAKGSSLPSTKGEPQFVGKNESVPRETVDSSDHFEVKNEAPQEGKKPRKIAEEEFYAVGSQLLESFSTCSGRNCAKEGDQVEIYSDPPKNLEASRVRFRSTNGTDIGRIHKQDADNISFLVWKGLLKIEARVIDAPQPLRVNSAILLHVRYLAHRAVFSDVENHNAEHDGTKHHAQMMFINFLENVGFIKESKKEEEKKEQNAKFLFNSSVNIRDEDKALAENIPKLKCELRDYQKLGVSWMVARERNTVELLDETNPLWTEISSTETTFYLNKKLRTVALTRPAIAENTLGGGVLADEMGLGKTVQTIATVLLNPVNADDAVRYQGGTLVVCPMSVLEQWIAEFQTHAEDVRVLKYYGYNRYVLDATSMIYRNADVVVTTYGVLASNSSSETLFKMTWHRVVLDEAHSIKNSSSAQAKAVFKLSGQNFWALTGTPIQNQPSDLFSLIKYLKVMPWGLSSFWNEHILKPYNSGDIAQVGKAEELIRLILQPLMLRRTKQTLNEDGKHILDLPELHHEVRTLDLGPEERDYYDALLHQSRTSFSTFVASGKVFSNMTSVLVLLLRLRQCCDHPFLVRTSPSKEQSNLASLEELIERFQNRNSAASPTSASQSQGFMQNFINNLKNREIAYEEQDCPICLDPMEDPVIASCAHAACRDCMNNCFAHKMEGKCPVCRQVIYRNELVNAPRTSRFNLDIEGKWQPSRKVIELLRDLEKIRSEKKGEKALIFSQWTAMLDLLEIPLRRANFQYLRLDGSVDQKERVKRLREFQDSSDKNVLLVSMKAGGVGLNLTMANHVFIIDPWWNPAVEDQAIGRTYRIGQTRPVHVTKYVVRDSVEERLLKVQEKKKMIVEGVVEETTSEARQLRLEEVKYLFS